MSTQQSQPSDNTKSCLFCRINQQYQQYYASGTTDRSIIEKLSSDNITYGTLVLAETDYVTVIEPITKDASSHILILSKKHINNINDVTIDDIQLLEHIMSVGCYIMIIEDKLSNIKSLKNNQDTNEIIKPLYINNSELTPYDDIDIDTFGRGWVPQNGLRFVYHKSPFDTIHHLHCHVHRLPYTNWINVGKYATGSYWCVDAVEKIKELKQQKRIHDKQQVQQSV